VESPAEAAFTLTIVCGRFTSSTRRDQLAERYEVSLPETVRERFNIAPTQQVLGVRSQEGEREAAFLRWGLVPHWAKSASIGLKMINARAETLLEKPAYRSFLKSRRCLIPADGFYEWKLADDGARQPVYFTLAGGQPFAFAALWARWRDGDDGELLESCTVITCRPNELVAPVHSRMPVILTPENEALWLDPQVEAQEAVNLLAPYPAELMRALEVSKRVNSVLNDDASLLEPDDLQLQLSA
jgi:putative SOS response-associated peptidase YedK